MTTLSELIQEIFDDTTTKSISICRSSKYGYQANIGHKDNSFYCEMNGQPVAALAEAIAHVLCRYDDKRKIEMTTITDFAAQTTKQAELETAKIRLEKAKENLARLFRDEYAASIIELVESILEYRNVKDK